MKGLVLKSTGSRYLVKSDGKIYNCGLKGKLRLEERKSTNPVAVGDLVDIEMDETGETGISKIYARKNYIIRKSINLSKQVQILASNLDQAVLLASLINPRTSLGFIDRFLVTAEAYRIPAVLLFNKSDLLNEELKAIQKETIHIYQSAGYACYEISSYDVEGVKGLIPLFKDKTTLIAGHSGVGKSTFINAIQPGLALKTGEISSAHNKGKHTTTFAELHELSFGGYVIDSPGIKELGLVEMKREEIGHYFPEIRSRMQDCKFNNCLHVNEPRCAILEAVKNGDISEERYYSYLGILNGEEMKWKEWEKR